MTSRFTIATLVTLLLFLTSVVGSAMASDFERGMAIVKDRKQLATKAKEAEKAFEAALQADPKNHLAKYNLGLLQERRGSSQAMASYKQTLSINSSYLPARARLYGLKLAEAANDEKRAKWISKLEEMVTCPEDVDCDKIKGKNPYQPEARNILAGVAIEEERWEDAARHARNVLLGDPENINAYVNLAVTYFRQGLVDQTWLIVSNALDRQPTAAALHNLMGLVHLKKDDSNRATKSFLRALQEDPLLVEAKMNLAALELSYGDFESALKRFDEILAVKRKHKGNQLPPDPMVVMSRAVTLRGLEQYDKAAAAYERVHRMGKKGSSFLKKGGKMPADLPSMALYNLCILHQQYTNQWDKAKQYCESFAEGLGRKHPKRREMKSRIAGIEATIEAVREEKEAEKAAQEEAQKEAQEGKTDEPEATPEAGEKTGDEGEK